jgi:hypothetical protein
MADVFTQHLGRGCYPSPTLPYSTYIASRNETSKAGCFKLPSLSYYGLSILRNNILMTIVPFSKLRLWEQISQQIKLSEILDFQSAASGSRIWVTLRLTSSSISISTTTNLRPPRNHSRWHVVQQGATVTARTRYVGIHLLATTYLEAKEGGRPLIATFNASPDQDPTIFTLLKRC